MSSNRFRSDVTPTHNFGLALHFLEHYNAPVQKIFDPLLLSKDNSITQPWTSILILDVQESILRKSLTNIERIFHLFIDTPIWVDARIAVCYDVAEGVHIQVV